MVEQAIYIFIWIGLSYVALKLIDVQFDWDPIAWLACVGFVGLIVYGAYYITRPEYLAERERDNAPFVKKTAVADGCVLYENFSNGRHHAPSTKFVRCPNSTTDTIEKKSCGKNCTREEHTQTTN